MATWACSLGVMAGCCKVQVSRTSMRRVVVNRAKNVYTQFLNKLFSPNSNGVHCLVLVCVLCFWRHAPVSDCIETLEFFLLHPTFHRVGQPSVPSNCPIQSSPSRVTHPLVHSVVPCSIQSCRPIALPIRPAPSSIHSPLWFHPGVPHLNPCGLDWKVCWSPRRCAHIQSHPSCCNIQTAYMGQRSSC